MVIHIQGRIFDSVYASRIICEFSLSCTRTVQRPQVACGLVGVGGDAGAEEEVGRGHDETRQSNAPDSARHPPRSVTLASVVRQEHGEEDLADFVSGHDETWSQ